jgi:hypothetical protein
MTGGTRLTLAFDGAVKRGVLGRLAARLLGNPRRLEAILDAYERASRTPRGIWAAAAYPSTHQPPARLTPRAKPLR